MSGVYIASRKSHGGSIMNTAGNNNQSFYQKVEQVNEKLRSYGKEAVQEIKMMKDGKVIGQIKYGYRPQYIFDAVNEFIGVENWRYEVLKNEQTGNQMIATVDVYMRIEAGPDGWINKGSQLGHMNVIQGNVGDALKGAITAAIQKGMSLWSIGSDAFKGKLETIWNATSGQKPHNAKQAVPKPATPLPAPTASTGSNPEQTPPPPIPKEQTGSTLASLPTIEGVTFEETNGVVTAKGSNLLKKRLLLQAAGFTQDRGVWSKTIAIAA